MNEIETNRINYGFILLRMLMTFEVVLAHCMDFLNSYSFFKYFQKIIPYAVPVFMMLSFYLTGNMYYNTDIEKFKKRILKLFLPHFLWSIIYWIVFSAIEVINNGSVIGIDNLFFQMIGGHSPVLNTAMWFQVVLIVLTVLYFFISKYCSNKYQNIIYILLLLLSLISQYSGLNYSLFHNLRYELVYPIGRFFEMIPYASIGIIFSQINIKKYIENKYIYFPLLLVLSVLAYYSRIYIPKPLGFSYQGLSKIIVCVFFVFLFGTLPLTKLDCKFKTIIIKLGKYTSCVYYSHKLINELLIIIAPLLNNALGAISFVKCLLIYAICYFLGWFITINSNKYKFFKYLINN